uniref:DNA polymerase III subunit gamma/tau n=1 Tax=uncultured SAR11 cluster bacterium HF0770_37D02 TaxID=710726 RepID=E0XYW2_9PROT|nr:DNA polymerase III, gamma/tau subunits [uncultured SAR11 cluster bacterium HF0770_37D02]
MKNNDHKILALKYRPKNFEELIGQDMMVQTITNSIKLDKLPNAYLLTGIRGVGKTTTARLIAKAINCKMDFFQGEKCNSNEHCHCKEIINSRHLDVLEMDAASRTGIDDVRELIESSKYNPTHAKYKIFIIDEVHMLSKQAFNGLLKTLEEPPPHLKFIFATTEVKKVPVTIVSRCQRFDLHRVSIKVLLGQLKKILKIENGNISDAALKLIAKTSEGSVRDSLSLLDRALVSQHITEKEIDETFVRKMLGIADRSKILELLQFIFYGNLKESIKQLREMINEGVEPVNFLNDFLEMIYFILQKKNIGDFDSDLSISESELKMIDSISKDVKISTLTIFWQFIIKGIDELSVVTNPILSLEMLIVRLIHLKDMPSYESILDLLNKNSSSQLRENLEDFDDKKINLNKKNEINQVSKDQIKNTTQTKPKLTSLKPKNLTENLNLETIPSFEDLIKLTSKKREVELKYDLERNVKLIKFSEGKIDINFDENIGKNFVRNLAEKLLKWTGKRWIITLTKSTDQKTFLEHQSINKKKLLEEEEKGEVYKKFKDIFSDGELVEVSKKK